ncbi:MAG TPA: sigma-70 family RNA polymerase sigma factor [Rhodocyclaceae bacterium]|nr:sigma-70 family RNA polymerase sigma factor [Rhodocyclaceae bacterium]
MDIESLVKRTMAGDKQAFHGIVKHFERPLFGFLGRMGLSQSHAEEIAQETFLRAWSKLGEYRPEVAQFSTWLFTIARNLALHELSRAASQRESTIGEDLDQVICGRPKPPDELVKAQQRRLVQAALLELSPTDRSALALAYIKDLDLTTIARIEGRTMGVIKTRLHRARKRLRQLLEMCDE